MIVDCPFCYAKVLPRQDGTCPSCQREVEDVAGADVDKAMLTIFESDEFPSVCFACGQPTDRSVRCRFDEKLGEGSLGWSAFGLLFFSPGKLIEGLNGFWFRKRLTFDLSQCESCVGPVTPSRIQLEEGEVDLLVHRVFREEVRNIRKHQKAA